MAHNLVVTAKALNYVDSPALVDNDWSWNILAVGDRPQELLFGSGRIFLGDLVVFINHLRPSPIVYLLSDWLVVGVATVDVRCGILSVAVPWSVFLSEFHWTHYLIIISNWLGHKLFLRISLVLLGQSHLCSANVTRSVWLDLHSGVVSGGGAIRVLHLDLADGAENWLVLLEVYYRGGAGGLILFIYSNSTVGALLSILPVLCVLILKKHHRRHFLAGEGFVLEEGCLGGTLLE